MNVTDVPQREENLLKAFSLGINFVEISRAYRGSEYLIGTVLRQKAEATSGLHVVSKTLTRSRDSVLHDIDRSLSHLGQTEMARYQLHDVGL